MLDPFKVLVRIRYSDCDAQGVMFNARYSEYVDVAVTEFYRQAFGSYQNMLDMGLDSQVVSLLIEWLLLRRRGSHLHYRHQLRKDIIYNSLAV